MESMPAEPESKIQRRGKVAVEHRSGYALAAWFLEEIANLREVKKIAEDIEEPLRTLILSQPDELTREEFLMKGGDWWKLLELEERDLMPEPRRSRKRH